jgi:endonuclease YncB( thermonuclease family)
VVFVTLARIHPRVAALLALIVSLTVAVTWAKIARAAPIDAADIRVIDGDTIRVHHKQPNVRLVGFNAPETRRAACPAERDLGDKATRRVRELVRAGNLDFEFVACSCPPGTQGTPACNYGRDCGTLKAAGRDVGEILIAEGLAVPFKCGATRCPRTPKPWCPSDHNN